MTVLGPPSPPPPHEESWDNPQFVTGTLGEGVDIACISSGKEFSNTHPCPSGRSSFLHGGPLQDVTVLRFQELSDSKYIHLLPIFIHQRAYSPTQAPVPPRTKSLAFNGGVCSFLAAGTGQFMPGNGGGDGIQHDVQREAHRQKT